MKKFIPILFSTPMVQALMDGKKTMTRRDNNLTLINVNPDQWDYLGSTSENMDIPHPIGKGRNDAPWHGWGANMKAQSNELSYTEQCPYGKPGDVLWVRETWAHFFPLDENENIIKEPQVICKAQWSENDECAWAQGDEIIETIKDIKWKPGIHMPMAAARIFLEVVSVKVERLQDITEPDAWSEGCGQTRGDVPIDQVVISASTNFQVLWYKINGEESWETNPFVWVIEFQKIDKPAEWDDHVRLRSMKTVLKKANKAMHIKGVTE